MRVAWLKDLRMADLEKVGGMERLTKLKARQDRGY